jgi:hypothetical protein
VTRIRPERGGRLRIRPEAVVLLALIAVVALLTLI